MKTEKPEREFTIPLEIKNWMVAVLPCKLPEETKGGLVIPDEIRMSEQSGAAVGRVIAIGDLAFKAQTRAGLNLADDSVKVEVGDYVIFPDYAGMLIPIWGENLKTKKESVEMVRIMKDDSIIAKTKYPGAFLDIK